MVDANKLTGVSALLDDKLLPSKGWRAGVASWFSTRIGFGEGFRHYELRGNQTILALKAPITKDTTVHAAHLQPTALRVCQAVDDTGNWDPALISYRDRSANKVMVELGEEQTIAECKAADPGETPALSVIVYLQPSWLGRRSEKFAVYLASHAWANNLFWGMTIVICGVSLLINVASLVSG